MKKRILKISLIANAVLLLAFVGVLYLLPSLNQQRIEDKREDYKNRQKSLFASINTKTKTVVFLGEDIIADARWQEMFNQDIANRGLRGDDLEGISQRLKSVVKLKPKKVFLQTGFRDLQNGKNSKDLIKTYDKLLKSLKKQLPKTEIYIINLSPIAYQAHQTDLKNEDLMVFNGDLRKLAEANKLEYVDMFTALLGTSETKEITPNYGRGGDFLSAAGYTRCQALLEQYVNDESDAATLEN